MRFLMFVVVLCTFLIPAASQSSVCFWAMYPGTQQFDPDIYTFPNSVCIYPDGRTSLSNAVFENLEIFLGLGLQHYDYDTGWSQYPYPDQGLQLGDQNTTIAICDNMNAYMVIDDNYPSFGYQPIYGGGHSAVDVNGDPISSAILFWAPDQECGVFGLELYFNSPDINGDLAINLTDVVIYSQDSNGAYNYRSDFNYDGLIDSFDYNVLVGAFMITCQ